MKHAWARVQRLPWPFFPSPEVSVLPDSATLVDVLALTTPIIGVYDSPDPALHAPWTFARDCVFAHYNDWCSGVSVAVDEKHVGCRGAGYWLRGMPGRTRDRFVEFLADEEGLKDSHATMNEWLDTHHPLVPGNAYVVIGPLKDDAEAQLRTVTFFVNPDQLSMLVTGAEYRNGTARSIVTAPFGSGCMQLAPLLAPFDQPRAIIGALDMAMREYLPPDLLAFTVTVPMFEQLCTLDGNSFLFKKFWRELQEARSVREV